MIGVRGGGNGEVVLHWIMHGVRGHFSERWFCTGERGGGTSWSERWFCTGERGGGTGVRGGFALE